MTLNEYLIAEATKTAWQRAADPNGREPTHQMIVNYLLGWKHATAADEYLARFDDLESLQAPLPLP